MDVKETREVINLENSFGEYDSLTMVDQIELALVDDGFLESLDRVKTVSEGLSDVLNFLFE